MVIGNDGLGQFVVGDDNHVVGESADGGAAPTDVGDIAFLAAVQLNIVAQPDLSGESDVEAGEQVREGILQGEGNGQAADTQGREYGGDVKAKLLEQDQGAEDQDGELRQ